MGKVQDWAGEEVEEGKLEQAPQSRGPRGSSSGVSVVHKGPVSGGEVRPFCSHLIQDQDVSCLPV